MRLTSSAGIQSARTGSNTSFKTAAGNNLDDEVFCTYNERSSHATCKENTGHELGSP